MTRRILISRDELGSWFIRAVSFVVDRVADKEMVYHCNENLGGPFPSLGEATAALAVIDSAEKPGDG